MVKKNRKFNPILLILLIAGVIRLAFLGRFPTGITNDELHFVLQAKAVFYNFTDMTGSWSPLSLTTIPAEASSEIIFPLIAPLIGPLPLNLFTARLPFVLFGVGTVYLIYLISAKLFSRPVGCLAALIAALNPWLIYVSRTSFDAPVAVFFFLLTFYLLLTLKGKSILLVFFPAAAAFYSYIGTKILLVPFTVLATAYVWHQVNNKKYSRYYLILNLLSLGLTLIFWHQLSSSAAGGRVSELYTPNSPSIIHLAEIDRNQSLTTPFQNLFSNRYVTFSKKFIQKYLNNFSPDILFLRGDPTYLVSLWKHGYFYYLDFFLIILGLAWLYSRHRYLFLLLAALVLISPLPEAIRHDDIPAYAFHSAFQYPFLIIFTALGVAALGTFFQNRLVNKSVWTVFGLVYFFSFLNFLYIYFFQYPVYQPEGFSFSRRLVASYLLQHQSYPDPVYVLVNEPDSYFRNYLFYSGLYSKDNFSAVSSIYRSSPSRDHLTFNGITFLRDPSQLPADQSYLLIAQEGIEVPPQNNRLTIPRLSDSLPLFRIYGDRLCPNPPAQVPSSLTMSDLNPASKDTICSKLIIKSD